MPTLVEEGLQGQALLLLQSLVDPHAVLGHHVPVVEGVRHQGRGLQRPQLIDVITPEPEVVVVAGDPVKILRHLLVADVLVAVFTLHRLSGVDEIVEHIDVLSHVTTRVADESIGAIVVIVGGIRCDRDDRL